MNQITIKFLQAQVDRLNRIAGTPAQPYVDNKAQIGCYHLSEEYGGYSLHQMSSEGGGVTDVLRCGHQPKRELSNRLSAFIAGLESAKL